MARSVKADSDPLGRRTLGPFTVHLWLATSTLGSPSLHSSHVLPLPLLQLP